MPGFWTHSTWNAYPSPPPSPTRGEGGRRFLGHGYWLADSFCQAEKYSFTACWAGLLMRSCSTSSVASCSGGWATLAVATLLSPLMLLALIRVLARILPPSWSWDWEISSLTA